MVSLKRHLVVSDTTVQDFSFAPSGRPATFDRVRFWDALELELLRTKRQDEDAVLALLLAA